MAALEFTRTVRHGPIYGRSPWTSERKPSVKQGPPGARSRTQVGSPRGSAFSCACPHDVPGTEAGVAVSKRTRFDVFKRDKFACQYCGRCPPAVVLEIDHVTPRASGGGDDEDNLLASCFDCNRGKSDRHLTDVPSSVTDKLAIAKERAEQTAAYNDFLLEQRRVADFAIEQLGICWFDKFKRKKSRFVFGEAREASVRRFLKYLPEAVILDAIDTAHSKFRVIGGNDERTWRYFCGVCWGKIREAGGQS